MHRSMTGHSQILLQDLLMYPGLSWPTHELLKTNNNNNNNNNIWFEALHGEVSIYIWFAVERQFSKNKLYLASRYTRGVTANQIYKNNKTDL